MTGLWSIAVPLLLLVCLALVGVGMIVVMRNGEQRDQRSEGDAHRP